MLVFLGSFSYSYSFDNFHTELLVYPDGVTKVNHEIILDSTDIEKGFVIPVYSPESLIVNDEAADLKFGTIGINLIIQPKERIDDYKVNIQYLTNDLTMKKNGEWVLKYMIPAYNSMAIDSIDKSSIIVYLPETSTILSTTPQGIVFTEKNFIKVGFKPEINRDSDNEFIITYSNKIEQKTERSFLLIAILLGFGVVLALGLYLSFRNYKEALVDFFKKNKISNGKRTVMKTLDSKEKDVLMILLESKKEIYQSKVQKISGISKATISRIIKRLESKSLINIEAQGNANILSVQEWFLKK